MFESVPIWMMVLGFLLVLGPLVTVHELGHLLVGRIFGIKADAFSIGFGKELFGWNDKRGTRWKVSALPLGGYVQFKGDMNPASIPDPDAAGDASDQENEGSFQFAALWKRALVVAAGPVTNLLVALAIFAAFNLSYGKPVSSDAVQDNTIASFAEVSAAREAGLRVGDKILSIDGEEVKSFQELQRAILLYPGRDIDLTFLRDGEQSTVPIKIGKFETTDKFGNASTIGLIGIAPVPVEREFVPVGVGEALSMSGKQSVGILEMMFTGIAQIISGDRSVKELGGPIKIAKYSGEQLSQGPEAFVWFVALISINLAFINLLPIPALDGGHLAFYAAEAIRRKPVGARGHELAYRTGVAFVLALMLFVTFNDLASLPIFGR